MTEKESELPTPFCSTLTNIFWRGGKVTLWHTNNQSQTTRDLAFRIELLGRRYCGVLQTGGLSKPSTVRMGHPLKKDQRGRKDAERIFQGESQKERANAPSTPTCQSSSTPVSLQFPDGVVLNAVGRKRAQMSAKECK